MVWITVHEQVLTIIVLHLEPYNCTKPHKKFSQVKSIKFQVSPVETLPFLTRGRQLEINRVIWFLIIETFLKLRMEKMF